MKHEADKIRNILFVGHRGSGKTSLIESLASVAKNSKKGSVEEKNSISDYTTEEKNRLSSCNLSVVSLEYKDHILNLLDAPGNDDFVFEIIGAMDAVKGAVLVIDATKGLEVGTIKHYNMLKKRGVPTIIFVNKMDKEMIDFDHLLEEINEKLGKTAISFVYPIGHQDQFDGFIDVVTLKARKYDGKQCVDDIIHDDKKERILEIHNALTEQVALSDESLLDKFFGGETLTMDEIHQGLHKAVINGELTPVLVGSARKDIGIETMLEMLIEYLPAPNELKPYTVTKNDGSEIVRRTVSSEPFSAFVFRTYFDQYRGATSVVKIASGSLKVGDEVYVPNINDTIKISQMFFLFGKEQIPTNEAFAGDIVAINKMDAIVTGYTLCDKNNVIQYPRPKYPTAVYYRALEVKNVKDEEKLYMALSKMQMEDPTLDVNRNAETKQLLLGALSDSHIAYVLEKVQNSFNIPVDLVAPRINYRETIKNVATAPGRYIKQSGGSGFYGVVEMRFEPSGSDENVFTEEVFGGAVPRNYFPAVEKGFFEATQSGLLAGFPVVGMKAVLTDGKYHSVDSNELAFKMAAVLAFKEAYMKCNPTLLEPIMKITINVNNEFTGNIMNDLNQRRARILSMDEKGHDIQEIVALVPEVEILDYAIKMRLLSQGSGYFNRQFDSYQQVPSAMVDDIIKAYAKFNEEK
ncbi:MAG TPA: elongation factor G [Bacilli bacterium]|nr:elongation factor G [Bacilli bacterium]MDD4344978.1 elongation factor G [Bacilli bacterium]MDD4521155.1 elongation factor G [Bacilli bacterium]HKM11561.1 elongation factor G [Bacilli bacterium]